MAQEIELKLELTADAAENLLASGLLTGDRHDLHLHTVYFDTPDRALANAGFSLRVRRNGDRLVQTVKAAGASMAGLFARPEWERPVDTEKPVLDESTPLPGFLGAKVHEVGPVFELRVERLAWELVCDGSTVEVVLDRGQVVAAGRSAPICEIELELKTGKPAALFSLARRFAQVAPLHVGVVNKASRGVELLAAAPNSFKAGPIALGGDTSAAEAFRRIAASCLYQYRRNEVLIHPCNPEALHQARIALRRLRSAFSIFSRMVEDAAFDRLRAEARWLANSLGDARDHDVMVLGDRLTMEDRGSIEPARIAAYQAVQEAIASARARALLLDLSEWLAVGDWQGNEEQREVREEPARSFAVSALGKLRRKVKKRGRSLESLSDDERHEVRKDAKKLRYASEFFNATFDDKRRQRRTKRFIAALGLLQDQLGALNDLAMSDRVLLGVDDKALAAPLVDGRLKKDLLEKAADAHDAFCDAKPFWR